MIKSIAAMNIQKMAQWVVKNVAVQTSHELDKMKDHKTGKLSGCHRISEKWTHYKEDFQEMSKEVNSSKKIFSNMNFWIKRWWWFETKMMGK